MTTGNTYKVVELVGTSPEGIDRAIENAINRAGQTLRGIDWSEVKEIRGQVEEGKVADETRGEDFEKAEAVRT